MKTKLLACVVALACLGSAAASFAADAFIPPEIEDQRLLGINKQPAHATLMPYPTLAEA